MDKDESTIGDYYQRCEEKRREAAKRLKRAREQGAPADVIRRLEREYELAAYTGD